MQRTDIYCKYTKAGLRDRAQTTADIVGVTLTPGVQKFPFIKDERITNRQINDLMGRSLYRFYENWGLIRFERMDIGQSAYHMLYLAVAVTNVIILAAAVSCIGSSFAISMEEKRKSYGMLASVGATPRQIRQSVYYEAFLTGRTAIPLGTVLGTGRIPYSICMFTWHGRCLSPVFYSQLSLLFFPRAVRQNRRQKVLRLRQCAGRQRKAAGQKSGRSRLQSQDVRRFLFWYPILWEYRRFR